MNNNENPLRKLIEKAIDDTFNQVHYANTHPNIVPPVEHGKWKEDWISKNLQSQSLPVVEQPEKPEGKHVCCGMIKNPDTGQYQKEPHDLCDWSCQSVWQPSQPEGKTLEEFREKECKDFAHWIFHTVIAGRTITKLWNDYVDELPTSPQK